MKNEIEIKNGIVRKTYTSRMDFLREEKLYKLLEGTGLAPKLLDSRDGLLEHEYVTGENYLELLAKSEDDYEKLAALFEKFYDWYKKYRELTNLTLGQVRFEKFLLTDSGLMNLEFENCKPGYMEEDLAKLSAQMCMVPEAFSRIGVDMARFFICVGAQNIEYNPEKFAWFFPKAVEAECKDRGVEYNAKIVECITTALTSSAVIFAGGQTPLQELTDQIALYPQKFISLPRGKAVGYEINFPGFTNIQTDIGMNNTLERVVVSQNEVSQLWTWCITTDMPKIPDILWEAMFNSKKEGVAAIVIEAGGKLREFPLLLNNSMTRLELQSALNEGEKSLTDALSKLPIKVIRIEDIQ